MFRLPQCPQRHMFCTTACTECAHSEPVSVHTQHTKPYLLCEIRYNTDTSYVPSSTCIAWACGWPSGLSAFIQQPAAAADFTEVLQQLSKSVALLTNGMTVMMDS